MSSVQTTDLTNCDKEAIHLLGKVQSFGAVLALSTEWQVLNFSENIHQILEIGGELQLNTSALLYFEADAVTEIRQAIQQLNDSDTTIRLFALKVFKHSQKPIDVCLHLSSQTLIFDLELSVPQSFQLFDSLRIGMRDFSLAPNIKELIDVGVQRFAGLIGFDRIMIYQFHSDGSGEVVAEALREEVDSFLGMRYPGSDIPKQARALYLRNLTRLIYDVDGDAYSFVDGTALDLSMCAIRSVSPIHLEYLRNMGVKCSFSLSIVVNNQLWGLVACHNSSPRYLSMEQRSLCEALVEAFSLELSAKIRNEAGSLLTKSKSLHLRMMAGLDVNESIFENFAAHAKDVKKLIECDTLLIAIEDKFERVGKQISIEDAQILVAHLNKVASPEVRSCENLAKELSDSVTVGERFAGYLAIPISRRPRDYIIFLRKEVIQKVTWAGNPEKPVEFGPNGARLSPRKSFAAWQELKRAYCAEWKVAEIGLAEHLKNTLMEIIIRNIDERARAIADRQQQQDVLIHELNHRVRNILGLIKSVVSQTALRVNDIDEFKHVLDGRLHSFALAQNKLTENNWQHSPLRELIEASLSPYCELDDDKVSVEGEAVNLSPKAYTSMCLVVHELSTNAVKYGAFKHPDARLKISWTIDKTGALSLHWLEQGVLLKEVGNKGFGTTIIQRSIPYDLGGSAQTDYNYDGISVHLKLPVEHVSVDKVSDKNTNNKASAKPLLETNYGKMNALITEDNMVIALDLEDTLSSLGFKNVYLTSTVKESLNIVNKEKIDVAFLDINLGHETSFPIAETLQNQNKPFVFLTGYGELHLKAKDKFTNAKVLSKPADMIKIKEILKAFQI